LLRLKHSIPKYDEPIQRQIREGLSLLGYAEPLPAKGIRILSIDGGGTRFKKYNLRFLLSPNYKNILSDL
jgi:hypothetical protein